MQGRVKVQKVIPSYCRTCLATLSIVMLLLAQPAAASESETLDLDEHLGNVVVLDFWASWCVPCRRSFPWMNHMQQKYADRGLIIIAVNLDNIPADAADFLEAYPANFQIVYDTDKSLAREFGVQAMPSSLLIGRDGNIIDTQTGFKVSKQNEYEAAISDAIDQN